MQIGDKVVCIKNFNENHYSFAKDKIYSIAYIHYRLAAVAPLNYCRLSNEILGKSSEHFWFSTDPIDPEQDLKCESPPLRFDDYFVDIKKNRKDKILKINEKEIL